MIIFTSHLLCRPGKCRLLFYVSWRGGGSALRAALWVEPNLLCGTTFCCSYAECVVAKSVTNHLEHKLGQVMEVDWSLPVFTGNPWVPKRPRLQFLAARCHNRCKPREGMRR